jgi:hypothetical protein
LSQSVEKQKLQNHVPSGLMRAIEIEVHSPKNENPTVRTVTDAIVRGLELVLEELAAANVSERGKHIAYVFATEREMELEERLEQAELKIAKYKPRVYNQGTDNIRAIRGGE